MQNFIALQSTYDDVQIGLFIADPQPRLIASTHINKIHASKELVPMLNRFLKEHTITLEQLPFIGVNQGPGPFTTLRVVIATVNGISFASNIPLIGVDALETVRQQVSNATHALKVIMFNGFSFDVYVLIEQNGTIKFKGFKNIDELLNELSELNQQVAFYGNGISLYREKITTALKNNAVIVEDGPLYSSLEPIGTLAFAEWQRAKKGSHQLQPLYIKKHPMQQ